MFPIFEAFLSVSYVHPPSTSPGRNQPLGTRVRPWSRQPRESDKDDISADWFGVVAQPDNDRSGNRLWKVREDNREEARSGRAL
jgi:hypothetical protein